ncbi:putative major capsid protein [Yellowstone lake phycodnavirus 3]|jgi:hypothetical protein|uniref:putative major capsid protein n=1 Tax=Yellowstone lake phycodnavirus 3 TaxID=1586715 RepID=UPI0006EBBCE5|nr:putative major capsid protein [Yellowstone lake phycodnavirus 3]BAT22500.1 putative major capsid protein [Yellowstone lake phycodnavirus 3]
MSGGIVQLVATGPQDAWLTGKPEVSFYRSNYKRYTHFANSVERQVIQGTPIAGGISTVRFEKKGDLLTYVYLTAKDSNGSSIAGLDWTKVIDKIELYIGGQVVDTHDIEYMTDIEPVTGAQNWSQRYLNLNSATFNNQKASFLPLKFFFCKDWAVALPLVALQFHDVELRITWSANLTQTASPTGIPAGSPAYSSLQYICWANYTYLDQGEREWFAKTSHDLLVTQVQRVLMGTAPTQELALAQPVKFIAFPCINYNQLYASGSANAVNTTLKTQVNGVDVGEARHLSHWIDVPQYYNTQWGYVHNNATANVAIISYCLDTSKLQPTGTLNFSRLDTFRIVVPPALTGGLSGLAPAINYPTPYLYAVNYNVLRIQNGLGSLLYAN